MQVCKYCGGEAFFPPKTKWGGWCCEETFYKCKGYKSKIKHTPWNKGLTKETDIRVKKCGETYTKNGRGKIGRTHTQESKDRIAISMRGNNNGKHRGDRQSFYNEIRMDSSWEVKVARYLDSKDIGWQYGEKVFVIDERRSYRPDFILHDGKIIEVKGYWRKENREKFARWRELYPNEDVEIWDKNKLKELGIL